MAGGFGGGRQGVVCCRSPSSADILIYPLLELRKPVHTRNAALLDTGTLIHDCIALVVAAAGVWVMVYFKRVHAWMQRAPRMTPPEDRSMGASTPPDDPGLR